MESFSKIWVVLLRDRALQPEAVLEPQVQQPGIVPEVLQLLPQGPPQPPLPEDGPQHLAQLHQHVGHAVRAQHRAHPADRGDGIEDHMGRQLGLQVAHLQLHPVALHAARGLHQLLQGPVHVVEPDADILELVDGIRRVEPGGQFALPGAPDPAPEGIEGPDISAQPDHIQEHERGEHRRRRHPDGHAQGARRAVVHGHGHLLDEVPAAVRDPLGHHIDPLALLRQGHPAVVLAFHKSVRPHGRGAPFLPGSGKARPVGRDQVQCRAAVGHQLHSLPER